MFVTFSQPGGLIFSQGQLCCNQLIFLVTSRKVTGQLHYDLDLFSKVNRSITFKLKPKRVFQILTNFTYTWFITDQKPAPFFLSRCRKDPLQCQQHCRILSRATKPNTAGCALPVIINKFLRDLNLRAVAHKLGELKALRFNYYSHSCSLLQFMYYIIIFFT